MVNERLISGGDPPYRLSVLRLFRVGIASVVVCCSADAHWMVKTGRDGWVYLLEGSVVRWDGGAEHVSFVPNAVGCRRREVLLTG